MKLVPHPMDLIEGHDGQHAKSVVVPKVLLDHKNHLFLELSSSSEHASWTTTNVNLLTKFEV